MAFIYLKVKSAKCLHLLQVVLVLSFWPWSCKQRSWSWSRYFGLGLKNLVLFTSLAVSCSCSIVLIDTSTAINGKSSRNCNAPKTLEKFTVHNPLPACMRLKLLLFAASCSNPVTRRALGRGHTHDDDDDDEAIITRDVT